MFKRKLIPLLIAIILILSLTLAACQQAEPEVTPEEPGEVVVPEEPEVEEPVVEEPAAKKVATFIWTQEFDNLNPLYTNMWFSSHHTADLECLSLELRY
jgi:hypothetical protein